jgi:hypothetical protein
MRLLGAFTQARAYTWPITRAWAATSTWHATSKSLRSPAQRKYETVVFSAPNVTDWAHSWVCEADCAANGRTTLKRWLLIGRWRSVALADQVVDRHYNFSTFLQSVPPIGAKINICCTSTCAPNRTSACPQCHRIFNRLQGVFIVIRP